MKKVLAGLNFMLLLVVADLYLMSPRYCTWLGRFCDAYLVAGLCLLLFVPVANVIALSRIGGKLAVLGIILNLAFMPCWFAWNFSRYYFYWIGSGFELNPLPILAALILGAVVTSLVALRE